MSTNLSIRKLYRFIESAHFYNCHFFTIDGLCTFVKIISKINFESYMLYIPSKYNINMTGFKSNELKMININNKNDIVVEYAYNKTSKEREDMYHDHGVHKDISEDSLSDNYRTEINIDNVKSKDHEDVKCLYRQMKRFKYSVENLPYKLVIMWKCYLCVIHRDNEVNCYFIKNFKPTTYEKQLLVCTDLEILFNKNTSIHSELAQVKYGIEKIINKNYIINIKHISGLVQKNVNVSHIHNIVKHKKEGIDRDCLEIKNLLKSILIKEKLYKEQGNTEELDNLAILKLKIIMKLNLAKTKKDHLCLLYDKILFDNIIMLDQITKNINLLNEI